jgi:Tfp pilus assembly protein PilF
MLHRATICILFLALCILPAIAQQPRGMSMPPTSMSQLPDDASSVGLTGSVRTADNKPVSDARVEVINLVTGQMVAGTYTSPSGTFDINNISDGNYEVRATIGLDEAHDNIQVRGIGANVDLRLRPQEKPEAGDRHTVSVAQFKVPGKAREAFKKAQSAISKQKLDEASKYVEEALSIYPEYGDALTLRGILKLDVGHAEAACEDLDHAIKADSNNGMAYIALGAALNTLKKYDEALRALDRGTALTPTSWQAYFEMGKSLLGKGTFDAALRQINKAEDMGPKDYALIHLVKAHALLGLKNYSEAMAELQFFLEKAPSDQNSAEARQTLEKVRAFAAVPATK